MRKLVIDIREKPFALQTLSSFSGLDIVSVRKMIELFSGRDEAEISSSLESFSNIPSNIDDTDFVFTHITSSAEQCKSIRNNGVLNLAAAYRNSSSELRIFLDAHDIDIRIDYQCIKYKNDYYSIEYDPYDCPAEWETEAYNGWLVGRKFVLDPGICGFMVYDTSHPYLGRVHECPEILRDLDRLLGTGLAEEWKKTSHPYAITCRVPGRFIEIDQNGLNIHEAMIRYLEKAIWVAISGPTFEETVQCWQHTVVRPEMIINIEPFKEWR